MKEALRTSGTSSRAQAGALGMLGADGVLVRVSAIVGRGLADAVFVVVIGRVDVVESEVRAARIEVVGERLVLVGALEIGVYVLEGRGERGLVKGGESGERALLEKAREVREVERGKEKGKRTASERMAGSSFARDSGGNWNTRAISWRMCRRRASKEGATSGSRGCGGPAGCLGGAAEG